MANVTQIYSMVNAAAQEAMGLAAVSVKDTAGLVSLGEQVLSSTENTDKFYQALVDRIGRTVIAVRTYTGKKRSVKRDEMDWGIWYQKISYKKINAQANTDWDKTSTLSKYDITPQTEAVQNLFSKVGTFRFADAVPQQKLYTAFTNAEAMGAFISGIYTNMDNMIAKYEEDNDNLAVATNIAVVLSAGKASQKRNLLAEYNTAHAGATLTVDNCLESLDFLKFAAEQIGQTQKYMEDLGVAFNCSSDIPRHTNEENCVVEVLSTFAKKSAFYLQSDTFHKELVELPRYEEVSYWQGSGTGYGFADVSKVSVQNGTLNLTAGGILAFVHDKDSCASVIRKKRAFSTYDEINDRLVFGKNFDYAYAVDKTENAVVFYIAATE